MAGSLIQLHHHLNIDVLDALSDVDGGLYYNGAPVYTPISKQENNAIVRLEDGIFVSNLTMLSVDQYNLISRFSFEDGNLLFDNVIVSREYTDAQIRAMITDLWNELDNLYPEIPDNPKPPEETIESNFITKDRLIIQTQDGYIFTSS